MNYTPIIEKILDYISSNLKANKDLSLGVEIENIVYDPSLKRLPVNGGNGFTSQNLKDRLLVLNRNAHITPSLTIEPGGQIEYGSTPFTDIHHLHKEWQLYQKNLFKVCMDENLTLLDFSTEPIYIPAHIPIIDIKKYHIMHERFSRTGKLGHWMMKNSASLQINLDYTSQQEAAQMAFISDCLQPFLFLMFANAPFTKGKPAGTRNLRIDFWDNTDTPRCGYLLDHGIQSTEKLLLNYANLVYKTPAIFITSNKGVVQSFDGLLGEWLIELSKGNRLTKEAIKIALHQIFTHVRFKNILEIRGPDRPPFGFEMAPVALVTGLLRPPIIRERLLEIVSSWSPHDRRTVQQKASILDLTQTAYNGKSFRDWIERFFEMALEGLDIRCKTMNIPNERGFLEPFVEAFLSHGPFALQIQREFEVSDKSLKDFLKVRWLKQKELQKNYS